MRVEFVRRKEPSRLMLYLTPLLAVAMTMIIGGLLVALFSYAPPKTAEEITGVCAESPFPTPAALESCSFESERAPEEILAGCPFFLPNESGFSADCSFEQERTLLGLIGFGAGAVYEIFVKPVLDIGLWPDLLAKAAPLVLIGVGLAIGFRANVWNIGAEGQYIVGAVAGTGAALLTWEMAGLWILPLVCVAGALGGALYAAIPALLRTRLGVSEILTSLMLNYAAIQLLLYLVFGPWKNPEGHNFPGSRYFTEWQRLPTLDDLGLIHLGVPITLAIALVAWFAMSRSVFGFQIRVAGLAPRAGRYGGFDANRTIWLSLLLSGALAGLAGVFQVSGAIGQLVDKFPTSYGYTAIIVAFLGRLHPIGVVLAGLAIAVVEIGGDEAQAALGLPDAAADLCQALTLFLLLATDVLVRYRLRVVGRAPARESARKEAAQGEAEGTA